MFKIIIVTHGNLAQSLLETSQLLLGEQPGIFTYCIWPGEELECVKKSIKLEIETSIGEGQEVLVLTDIFFGTPFNIVTSLMEEQTFYHITGINLPLLADILCRRQAVPLGEILKNAVTDGQKTIMNCNELLEEYIADKG